jgi:hypothetical protein
MDRNYAEPENENKRGMPPDFPARRLPKNLGFLAALRRHSSIPYIGRFMIPSAHLTQESCNRQEAGDTH